MYIKMFKVSRSCLKEILLACWLNMNVLLLLAISYLSFSGGSVGKNPPANTGDARDAVSIPGTRRSLGVGNGGNTTQIFLSGKFPGQRSLVGYSPWGHKESEMTKHSTASLIYSVPGTVQASLVAQLVRYLPAIGRPGSNPRVGKILWIRERLPKTPIFWPGEFQGLYNPWGCKELAMTERLLLHFRHFTKCFTYSIAFNSWS